MEDYKPIGTPIGYSDVDFIACKDDIKSTSNYIFLYEDTQQAKCAACNVATTFVVWINRFLKYLKLKIDLELVQLYCDNKTAIYLTKNGVVSSKSKHMSINDIVVDPLTKRILEDLFTKHVAFVEIRYL
ncbi:hypothetical protein EJ110_NYTH33751 [Nymphaea thermarum]|nr:hypothetical protein EJ110_NYTH33751 [Nymphaea thermarum]